MNVSVTKMTPDLTHAAAFRQAMRLLASGVSVVTHGVGGERTGLTATSVCSLSTEPPSLIVCVNRTASLYARLGSGDLFGVNLLGAEHAEIAERFAGRSGLKGSERFRDARWITTPSGVSLLADAIASFECEAEDVIERHSHAIVIGRVRNAASKAADGALVYWRGGFDRIGWSPDEILRAIGVTPSKAQGQGSVVRFCD